MSKRTIFCCLTAALLRVLAAGSAVIADPLPLKFENGRVLFRFEDAFADKITVAGQFNDWNSEQYILRPSGNDIYSIEIEVPPGTWEYKYIVDGNWMQGDNLKFKLSEDQYGNIVLKEKRQRFNVLGNTKVYLSGEYNFKGGARFEDRSNSGRKSWRLIDPDNDMDLNVELSINPQVSMYANLNANFTERNNAQFRLDEANVKGVLGPVSVTGFLNQRLLDIDDPLRIVDVSHRLLSDLQDQQHYVFSVDPFVTYGSLSNASYRKMYLLGEERDEGFRTGRGLQGALIEFEPWGIRNQLFFLDSIRSRRTFLGYRGRKTWDLFYIGALYYADRGEDGLFGNLDGTGDRFVTAAENGTNFSNAGGNDVWWRLDAPDFWTHKFDNLLVLDADGKNQNRLAGIDAGVMFDYVKLYFQYLNESRQSAYVATFDGVNDVFDNNANYSRFLYGQNDANTRSFGAQILGGNHRSNILMMGARIDYSQNIQADIFWYLHDRESTMLPLTGDTQVLQKFSPQRNTVTGRLRYTGTSLNTGLEFSHTSIKDYPAVTFDNVYDEYGFYGLEIFGARKRTTFTLLADWSPVERLELDFGERYKTYKYYDKKATINLADLRASWKWTKRLLTDISFRVASYDVNDVEGTYVHPYAGFRYRFLKNVDLRFYYGLDYRYNDDKFEGGRYDQLSSYGEGAELSVKSPLSTVDPNVNNVLHGEDFLKRDRRITLEARVVFD